MPVPDATVSPSPDAYTHAKRMAHEQRIAVRPAVECVMTRHPSVLHRTLESATEDAATGMTADASAALRMSAAVAAAVTVLRRDGTGAEQRCHE